MAEFKVLPLKEEQLLSTSERKKYYEDLRRFCLNRKLTNTTKGATLIGPCLRKITIKIAIAVTKAFTNKNIEWVVENNTCLPEGPVIFAHSHQGILDTFIWIPEVDRHCLILHSYEVNKLLKVCQSNTGLVLVKKGNKVNNANAKLDMISLLLRGNSITYFPESAWNLSPNKLHLPLSYGVIDTAKKANVPIVPVVHELTYDTSSSKELITKIHSRYGKPIYVKDNDTLLDKLKEYEESISTMRYELIEAKGLFKRKDISNFEYINYLKGNLKNLELGKVDINRERKYLFNSNDEFYKFHHINDVPFNEYGELLETEEVRRLKDINRRRLNVRG